MVVVDKKFGVVSYVLVGGQWRNATSGDPPLNRPAPGPSPTREQAVFLSTQSQCERHQLVQSAFHLHIFSLGINYITLQYLFNIA